MVVTRKHKVNVLNKFVSKLQELGIMTQIFHWSVHSYNAHLISGDLISLLSEFTDSYVETLVGLECYRPSLPRISSKEHTFPHIHIGKVIDKLLQHCTQVSRLNYNEPLDNLVEEFAQQVLKVKAKVQTLPTRERRS